MNSPRKGELIPIIEEFQTTIILLWLSINSLKSYKEKEAFFWEIKLRILKLKASGFFKGPEREKEKLVGSKHLVC